MALDLETKRAIGQHFVFGFAGHEVNDDIRSLIRDYYVGNVILMKRNIQRKCFEQVHKLVHDLQQLAKDSGHEQPLLIGIDQENGLVSGFTIGSGEVGTQFPGAMRIAATGSTELAEEITRASGSEMRLAGINWVYSPVADVNTDPRNPVIGPRSFGDDPTKVGEFACAVSRGLIASGIAPTAKHFPGHGDTHVDSHLGLPRILKSLDELGRVELVPFRSLIVGDVATIMTGHMALPKITGSDVPCSLSKDVTTLLRGGLRFKGVIVTDCLEMDAVVESYGVENGALMALDAGADIAMICHTPAKQKGAVELVQSAVASGKLALDSLWESNRRISHLKSRFAGSWSDVLDPILDSGRKVQLKSENTALSASAYSASTALVADPAGVLPISEGDAVVLFTPAGESLNRAVYDAEDATRRTEDGEIRNTPAPYDTFFGSSISARTQDLHHIVYTNGFTITEEFENRLSAVKYIVFATRNANQGAWQLQVLSAIAQAKNADTKVIIISTCAPYDLLNTKLGFPFAYLVTFEFTHPALENVTRVIFGEARAAAKVPVLGGNVL